MFTKTDGPDCLEISQTTSKTTQQQQMQQDDPLSMAVKTAFNSIKELQELAAPEAVHVDSLVPDPPVEGSITDISNAHVAINLPADEADLPVQSAHVLSVHRYQIHHQLQLKKLPSKLKHKLNLNGM